MTLLGGGAITIWNDVKPEARENFYAWHDGEHIAERVGIEGFLRGRRYIAMRADIEFFTLYETVDAGVMTGPHYKARLESPSEWTRRSVPGSINVTRGLTAVAARHGSADGGFLLAAGLLLGDAGAAAGPGLERLAGDLASVAGVCSTHLSFSDLAASRVQTAEKQGRAKAADVPDAVLLVEASREAPLTAAEARLRAAVENAADLAFLRPPGLYRLEFEIVKARALAG